MDQLRQRVARMLGCDHNPLRRGVDRMEAILTISLLIAFLVGAPLLGIFAGQQTDAAGLREQHAEQSWHRVPATLLQSASSGLVGVSGEWDVAWVRARWQASPGTSRTGSVATGLNAKAGDRVWIWVNRAGQLTHEPLSTVGLRDRITFAVTTTVMAVGILLGLVAACVKTVVDRRRLAGWERAWARIGPRWTSFR